MLFPLQLALFPVPSEFPSRNFVVQGRFSTHHRATKLSQQFKYRVSSTPAVIITQSNISCSGCRPDPQHPVCHAADTRRSYYKLLVPNISQLAWQNAADARSKTLSTGETRLQKRTNTNTVRTGKMALASCPVLSSAQTKRKTKTVIKETETREFEQGAGT